MSNTLDEINAVAGALHRLWRQRAGRRAMEDRRRTAAGLAKQLEGLWHRRRMEMAGALGDLYAYEDALKKPHMEDYVARLAYRASAGSRTPLYTDLVKAFNGGVAVQYALPLSA